MMAESLPFSGSVGPMSGLELDAWYEDLQDILFSETKNAGVLQTDADKQGMQVEGLDSSRYLWTVDSVNSSLPVSFTEEDVVALEAIVEQLPSEVLEFLNQGSQNNFDIPSASSEVTDVQHDGTVEVDSSCSSSPPSQTQTEDEESSGSQSGTKRKRSSQPRGGKVRAKEKEHENDKKVSYLMTENERLKGEIERLSLEVEKTRKALIERMVTLKKV
ncbi:PREDICTED: DNA damage-inducible transcript 3 protein [Nanorana parkeri]|uniref:DNA damage-inducible transcript 3 protein n=1 Tax=Nanorana parkeri TaxID=125878 RepID=UPI000854F7D8|nr:PREDICTED: DNA damage-inducible transcript 3 protein [Nanorana parkeri]